MVTVTFTCTVEHWRCDTLQSTAVIVTVLSPVQSFWQFFAQSNTPTAQSSRVAVILLSSVQSSRSLPSPVLSCWLYSVEKDSFDGSQSSAVTLKRLSPVRFKLWFELLHWSDLLTRCLLLKSCRHAVIPVRMAIPEFFTEDYMIFLDWLTVVCRTLTEQKPSWQDLQKDAKSCWRIGHRKFENAFEMISAECWQQVWVCHTTISTDPALIYWSASERWWIIGQWCHAFLMLRIIGSDPMIPWIDYLISSKITSQWFDCERQLFIDMHLCSNCDIRNLQTLSWEFANSFHSLN